MTTQLPELVKTFDDTRILQDVVIDSLDAEQDDVDFGALRDKLGPQGEDVKLKKEEVVNIAAALQYYANIIAQTKDVTIAKLFSPDDEVDADESQAGGASQASAHAQVQLNQLKAPGQGDLLDQGTVAVLAVTRMLEFQMSVQAADKAKALKIFKPVPPVRIKPTSPTTFKLSLPDQRAELDFNGP